MIPRCAVLAALLLAPVAGAGENRLWIARIEVEGPAERIVLDCGPLGSTTVTGRVRAGERFPLEIPLPLRGPLGPGIPDRMEAPRPRVQVDDGPAGSARFLGWAPSQPEGAWAVLDPELRLRPRPPVPRPSHAAPPSALLLLVAALVLGLAWRRRPRRLAAAALLAGAGAAAVVFVGASRPPPRRSVLEGRSGDPVWVEVTAGRDRLEVDPSSILRLETTPEGAEVVWRVALGANPRWEAVAPGVGLHAFERVMAGGGLERGTNPDLPLATAWVREGDGTWSARGAWAAGAPLGPPREGAAPPGWLAAGLSPGVSVLLGRLADPAAAGGGRWLRVSGI